MSLAAADIEAIERATLDAVPPEQTAVLDGWLLGLDRGTVGRAHSAVPLTHDGCDAAVLTAIQAVYARHGLSAVLRLPELPAFNGLHAALGQAGYTMAQPTCVLMQMVRRSSSRMRTHSTCSPSCIWRSSFSVRSLAT